MATTRDPSQIPFSSTSIFNLPLGTGAQWQFNSQLAGAGIWVNTDGNYNQPIYKSTASDPLVTVTSDGSWGGGAGTWTMHIPAGAVPSEPGDHHLAVDDTSTNTWYSFGGFKWTSPTTATAQAGSGEANNGSGLQDENGNWDYAVGTLRASDLAAGAINHMLRINVPTTMLESWDPNSVFNLAPYAWPNSMEDGFANGGGVPPGLTAYSGTIPYGVTIGIAQGVAEPADVAANAGADMLWRALQTHGAMVRDSTAPYGNSLVLQTDQGVEQNNPLIQDMEAFGNEILSHAEILTNQGPTSVNGGGTPVVPLDAPLSDSTSGGGDIGGGTSSGVTYITPGAGSFTDAAGNVYTVSTQDYAMENGAEIPGGHGTAEMAYANGLVYGEDVTTSTWATWNDFTWIASAAPPTDSGSSSSGTGTGTGSTGTGTGSTGGSSSSATVTYIEPGAGSFTDAAGNKYSLDAAGISYENGTPIPGGSGTAEMAYYNNTIYGEDAKTSTWSTWNQNTWAPAAAAPPPASAPPPPPVTTPPPQPSATFIMPGSGSFTDASGNTFTLTSGDAAQENGSDIPGGHGTEEMAYYNGQVYGEDAGGSGWYTWNQSSGWVSATAPPANTATPPPVTTPPPPPAPPPQPTATFIVSESGSFKDSSGNTYTLSGQDYALQNGSDIPGGHGTEEMAYYNGSIYGEDAGGTGWYAWSQNGGWVSAAAPPLSNATVNSTTTGSASGMMTFITSGNVINPGSGNHALTDVAGDNTIVTPSPGQGMLDIFGPVLTNGDKMDFTAALKGTQWDGLSSDVGKYLNVKGTTDATISISKNAGGAGSVVADLHGSGQVTLATLLQHSTI